jgi:hypothetical protein
MAHSDFLNQLELAMEQLGFTNDVPLDIAIAGSKTYEIEGAGTKWAPTKGTRKYNKDAFIVIRKVTPVISSNA